MDLKIKINGEFTKEELQEKLKEFDKLVWEIKKDKFGDISLFKKGERKQMLLQENEENAIINISTMSRDIAEIMNDLMETRDVLDDEKEGYSIYFDNNLSQWYEADAYHCTSDKHFKTIETAKLASKLLNESKDVKGWIKRMSE